MLSSFIKINIKTFKLVLSGDCKKILYLSPRNVGPYLAMSMRGVIIWFIFLCVSSAEAADSLPQMFLKGRFSGQIRSYYIDRNFTGSSNKRNGTAIGGFLRYETDVWQGLNLGAAVYTTNRIFRGLEYDRVDPSIFGKDLTSYAIPGEAFVNYRFGDTAIKIGRQPLLTPMICGDDARMIPCLYEAANLVNDSFSNTRLTMGHILRIAPGTMANTYQNGGVLAVTAGYSFLGAQENNRFHNIGSYTIGESTPGITTLGVTYSGFRNIKLQAWNYIAWNIMNALYLQGDFSWKVSMPLEPELFASGQLILEKNLGGHTVLENINSHYWALLAGAKSGPIKIFAAYSQTGSDPDAAINGGIITSWGGMPTFTQGMVTRHMFMAGTHAWKVQGNYDWNSLGVNLTTALYYASYDMNRLNGFSPGEEWTASEAGFDLIYRPGILKNLSMQFRGNFTGDYFKSPETGIGWNEFRFIINYDF